MLILSIKILSLYNLSSFQSLLERFRFSFAGGKSIKLFLSCKIYFKKISFFLKYFFLLPLSFLSYQITGVQMYKVF